MRFLNLDQKMETEAQTPKEEGRTHVFDCSNTDDECNQYKYNGYMTTIREFYNTAGQAVELSSGFRESQWRMCPQCPAQSTVQQ